MQSFIWPEGDRSPWLTADFGLGEDLNVETMPVLLASELPSVLKLGCTTLFFMYRGEILYSPANFLGIMIPNT